MPGAADFTMLIDGDWATGTLVVEGVEVTGVPDGGVPLAVAESLTLPLSRSA